MSRCTAPQIVLRSFAIVYSAGVNSRIFTKLWRLFLLIEEHHHHQHVWTSRTCSLLNPAPAAHFTLCQSQEFLTYSRINEPRLYDVHGAQHYEGVGGSLYYLWLVGLKSFPFFFHQLGSLLEDASVCSCISWLRFPFSPPLSFYFNAGRV